MKHIPTWLALGEIGMTLYFLVAFLAIAIYAPFWLLGGLSRKRRRPAERGMRGWPLVAVLIVVALGVLTTWANEDPFARLGSLTVWSAGLCAGTIAFAVAVLASAVALWRAPKEGVRRGVFRFSVFVTVALLIAAAYLVYWGMIGLRTWV